MREGIIRLWFDMWLQQEDLGIDKIFTEDILYIESWGPTYEGRALVKQWFEEWNTRGKVLKWDIQQYFHQGDQTVVEWYFQCEMNGQGVQPFDALTLIRWSEDGRNTFLKEFGCNLDRYDPYAWGAGPRFKEEAARWF